MKSPTAEISLVYSSLDAEGQDVLSQEVKPIL